MNIDIGTVKGIVETMSFSESISIIAYLVILVFMLVIVQGIANTINKFFQKKMIRSKNKNEMSAYNKSIKKSIQVVYDIQEELKHIRQYLKCNAAQIWLYSNGEKSFFGVCFNYQSIKYEDVEYGFPSIIQSSMKIATTATPYLSEMMFNHPKEIVAIKSVKNFDIPDKVIFESMKLASLCCAAIQIKNMTIGYLLVGWLGNERQKDFDDEEIQEIENTAQRLSGKFSLLEKL